MANKSSDSAILLLNAQRRIRLHHQEVRKLTLQLMREWEIVPHQQGLAHLLGLPAHWNNQRALQQWLSVQTCALAPEQMASCLPILSRALRAKLEVSHEYA